MNESYQLILSKLETMEKSLNKINAFIDGNGQVGLKVRLDRLEQAEDKRKWLTKTAIGSGIAAIISAAIAIFKS